jgi:hypothetical protein
MSSVVSREEPRLLGVAVAESICLPALEYRESLFDVGRLELPVLPREKLCQPPLPVPF